MLPSLFTPHLAVHFIQALLRSLAAMSDRIPVRTAPEKVHNGSVAYRVVKLEMSKFSALELPPGGVNEEHRDDFLKTWPTRDLTAGTRRLSAVHERERYTPSATASTYASQQSLAHLHTDVATPFAHKVAMWSKQGWSLPRSVVQTRVTPP